MRSVELQLKNAPQVTGVGHGKLSDFTLHASYGTQITSSEPPSPSLLDAGDSQVYN